MVDVAPLALSIEIAVIAVLIAVAVGVAVAAVLAKVRFWGRGIVDVLLTAPLVLPPTVLGYYLLVVLGRRSILGAAFEHVTGSSIVFTRAGAVCAAAVGALPIVIRSSRAAIESVDPTFARAARTLGASPLRALVTIELPLAARGIAAAAMLAFARALGDFGVTLMVAGDIPGETQTASLAIFDALQGRRESDALAMALVLTAVALVLLYAMNKILERRDAGGELRASVEHTLGEFSLNVSIVVKPGVTILFGSSGAGKSTTLAILSGLIQPKKGQITLGDEMWLDTTADIFRPVHTRHVGFVFQSLALFPHMTAAANVAYGIDRALPEEGRREKTAALLSRMRVSHVAARRPASLSGGEAQRVAIARALAVEPRLLLLDEPFSSLDRGLREELGDVVREIAADVSIPIVFVTHDALEAKRLGEHAIVLENGRVIREGAPDAVLD